MLRGTLKAVIFLDVSHTCCGAERLPHGEDLSTYPWLSLRLCAAGSSFGNEKLVIQHFLSLVVSQQHDLGEPPSPPVSISISWLDWTCVCGGPYMFRWKSVCVREHECGCSRMDFRWTKMAPETTKCLHAYLHFFIKGLMISSHKKVNYSKKLWMINKIRSLAGLLQQWILRKDLEATYTRLAHACTRICYKWVEAS